MDKMKIAWRYEGLSQVESSFGSNTSFGHHFDLSKHIDTATIESCNIEYCKLDMDSGSVNGKILCIVISRILMTNHRYVLL